ncbi:MAG: GGDEF domain-containing phosphodiesterase [Lactobacillus delbrueckii]|jgi:EAL domain-containing protein (putative c-di-GMP-specific phosphodiesterase class I)/GGDEF domain-containing protein|nr:GGDEF domain-containing phosphodiesterase [Lactobacillus delbrueckii]
MEIIKFTEQQRKDYEQLPTGMAIYQIIAGKPKTLLVTDELCRLLRVSREDLIANLDKSMFGFVHPDDIGRMAYFGKNFAAHTDEKYDVFFRWKTPKMEDYHIFHSWANHVLVDGVSLGFFFYSDVEESGKNNQILDTHYQKYANDQMYQDRLTKLPNRRFLEIFGMEEVAKLRLAKKQPVCMTLNIAGISVYNNLYGLKKGDLLLRELSEVLVSEIKVGHVYHNKDDRFLILTVAEGIDEKIKEIHEKFVNLAQNEAVDLQFGLYQILDDDRNIMTIAHRANQAMKEIGHDRRVYVKKYDPAVEEEDLEESYFLNNFSRAMDEGWLTAYFQPICSAKDGKTASYEALARWQDPEKGLVSPAAFIPVIEKNHLTYYLDMYILCEVVAKLQQWKKRGLDLKPVSVNLAHEDFEMPNLVEKINDLVIGAGLSRSLIKIEITERDLSNNTSRLKEQIDQLHSYGFEVWMDDFGSGYSSLNALNDYNFDLVKIDMAFVRHLDDGPLNRLLIPEIAKVAHLLGMKVLAEGVETEEQRDFLQEAGCDLLQGFLFSKPVKLDENQHVIS